MSRPLLAALLLSCVSAAAQARPPVMLLLDPSLSMEPGVRTLDSLTPLLFAYDAQLSARVAFDESTPARRAAGVLGRAGKLLALDYPLAQVQDTVLHEVFGHGARAREFGQRPVYDFRLPYPYRLLTGSSAFGGLTHLQRTGRMDVDLPITAAGLEAGYLSAWWIQARALEGGGGLHYSELLRYLNQKLQYGTRWASDLAVAPEGDSSSDPDQYVSELQRRHNRYTPQSRAETARILSRGYLWNLVDPTLWLSAYHLLVSHIWRGERFVTLPRFEVGRTWLYPTTRYNLSPFGAEHYLELFAGRDQWMGSAYVRAGSSFLSSYTGLGVRAQGIQVRPDLNLGGQFDLWRQPELLLEHRNAFDGRTALGGSAALHAQFRAFGPWGVVGKLALKSRGYLMGQPLAAGPYGYLGISLGEPAPSL